MTPPFAIPTPRGVRREWERTTIAPESAHIAFGGWAGGRSFVSACAWFDNDDAMRVLVGDTEDGWRCTMRRRKQSTSVTVEKIKEIAP